MTSVDVADDPRLPWASRVEKLLRKAEATTPEEAEALTAKAEEIMVNHSITDELLNHVRGEAAPEKIVEKRTYYTGIYRGVLQDICHRIAKVHNCRTLQLKQDWHYNEDGKKAPRQVVYIIGFESDVERVLLLDASLQIQCARAMRTWWKSDDRSWYTGMQGYKARREYILGFANGLAYRLQEAKVRGTDEGTRRVAEETGTTHDEVKTSTELVLRTRKQQVNDWMDDTYGDNLRNVTRRYQSGGAAAYGAGHKAGRSADLGQPGVGRNKQIGR